MTDQVIAEIERNVDAWTSQLGRFCMVFYAGNEWIASCHMIGLKARGADVMAVLREFDGMVRRYSNREDKLAQTLGLEAAE